MPSLVLCYAPQDEPFARELGRYLEVNLPVGISYTEGVVKPDFDLIEATERGLSAEVALVLLSPDSVPKTWRREIWEPVFFAKPLEFGTLLGFLLLRPCRFPDLVRRRYFFDASEDPLAAMRDLKRWLVRPQPLIPGSGGKPSAELNELRLGLADQPGAVDGVDPDLAYKFASECGADFEAVYSLDCQERSRAGIVGDLGSAMGLRLPGTLDRNLRDLQAHCRDRRVLCVLASVGPEARDVAALGGRTSVILTDRAAFASDPRSIGVLVRQFRELQETNPAAALRSGWAIVTELKSAERFAEVMELLESMARTARDSSDHPALSRIEREQFWMQDYAEGNISAPPHSATDAVQLAFGFALT
jgi:hypothetical protein